MSTVVLPMDFPLETFDTVKCLFWPQLASSNDRKYSYPLQGKFGKRVAPSTLQGKRVALSQERLEHLKQELADTKVSRPPHPESQSIRHSATMREESHSRRQHTAALWKRLSCSVHAGSDRAYY